MAINTILRGDYSLKWYRRAELMLCLLNLLSAYLKHSDKVITK